MASAPAVSAPKSSEEWGQWMQHVHEVQSKRTPEAFQAALERVERARQHEVSRRKCKAVKSHAVRSHALVSEGLRQMGSAEPQDYLAIHQRWRSAQEASGQRREMGLSRAEAASSANAAPHMTAVLQEEESDEEDGMREVSAIVGATDARALAGGVNGTEALLQQLRTEPTDESECAAKFLLYEGYASEVEQMRGSLFKFFEESRPTVPAAVAAGMDKEIKGIDTHEAMGIPDNMREWFVFHMMRAAERNNKKMAGILEAFEKRLEFLAANDQAECPVCLETFQESGAHVAETLGCCHKVCKDCWENWSAAMGGRPFCPLCRHDAFLGAVAERVTGARRVVPDAV